MRKILAAALAAALAPAAYANPTVATVVVKSGKSCNCPTPIPPAAGPIDEVDPVPVQPSSVRPLSVRPAQTYQVQPRQVVVQDEPVVIRQQRVVVQDDPVVVRQQSVIVQDVPVYTRGVSNASVRVLSTGHVNSAGVRLLSTGGSSGAGVNVNVANVNSRGGFLGSRGVSTIRVRAVTR